MDQSIRSKLRTAVTQCRKLLEEAVTQVLQGQFGISVNGKKDEIHVEDESSLKLTAEDQGCRRDLVAHLGHIQALGYKANDALAQLVREIAFTHLNRLCAYKMMEARAVWIGGKPFREAVSRGMKSQGFQFYLADDNHKEDKKLFDTGHQDIAYRHFLGWLGELLSEEIGVLFSPTDPANRLLPPQRVLDDVLGLLNSDDLKDIWTEDETIGWVYQYFTPKELRDQVRKESAAPRNSYELAFRNQFFTPRYVVEFLTDNTLGRIWYEMRKGDTKLKDQCRYMVRRPSEIFLGEGQTPPEPTPSQEDLSQEELLKQPVRIPRRPKKDPRELRILDPACGSGHFLLYCFDLLLTIYEEAYADPDLGPKLQEEYKTLDALKRDMPRLILAHNLHGINIDLRASQFAALALWLRCQRAYREMILKQDRPKITRSNIVCAEPMPGESEMLKEFVADLQPKVLGHLVEIVFDKMKLAGEAGSLLKIEEELRDAIADVKQKWVDETEQATDRNGQPLLFTVAEMDRLSKKTTQPQLFDFSEITDEQFWNEAEGRVLAALQDYARHAANGGRLQRQLFAEDAAQGFAFIDICQKRFDVVLMNPPFGLGLKAHFEWLKKCYNDSYVDICSSFISRASELCVGKVGAITSRSVLVTKKLARLRANLLVPRLELVLDLGHPVMDGATVQSCAYTIDADNLPDSSSVLALDRTTLTDKSQPMDERVFEAGSKSFLVRRGALASLSQSRVLYTLPPRILSLMQSKERLGGNVLIVRQGMTTFNDFRFLRLRAEVDARTIGGGKSWEPLSKGGHFSSFYSDMPVLVRWNKTGEEIAQENMRVNGQTAQARQASVFYRRPGGTYTRRCKDFGVRMLPAGCIIGDKGRAVFPQGEFSSKFVIGLLNSRLINTLVHIQANAKQFDSGIVEGLPWKPFSDAAIATIEEVSRECVRAVRKVAMMDETDSVFSSLPFGETLSSVAKGYQERVSQVECLVEESLERINREVDLCYGVDSLSLRSILLSSQISDDDTDAGEIEGAEDDETSSSGIADSLRHVGRVVMSASFGSIVGRWDLRAITNGQKDHRPPELFESLPTCSPAMLQGLDGLPAIETPKDYPLRINWDGIIPDDPDHNDDIVRRVREVLELIWKERADAIEKEACEILGVTELRDYFRKPGKGGFWDDHVYRYSKSRRKAPIYWLLQSSKKNYGLWLYYHRLDKDILFKARQNYADPKIRLEQTRLDSLRSQKSALGAGAKGARKIDIDIEKQEALLGELKDFADKLERAAKLNFGNPEKLDSNVVYAPDLNDGVVLNVAPLWELVPWKEAKNHWEELLEGKYEWSSMGKLLRKKGLVPC
jgi:hypothetical protein